MYSGCRVYSNESTSSVSGNVGVTVKLNGKTSSSYTINFSQSAGYYTYGDITITGFSYGNVSAEGGSSSPYITYTQPYGWNGSTSGAGTVNSGSNDDDGYTNYTGSATGATLNNSTGVVTWAENDLTSGEIDPSRSITVTATVSRNGNERCVWFRIRKKNQVRWQIWSCSKDN